MFLKGNTDKSEQAKVLKSLSKELLRNDKETRVVKQRI